MKKLNITLCLVVTTLFLCLSTMVFAAPINEISEISNNYIDENGKNISHKINVLMRGDEYYIHIETLSGYTLVKDSENNAYCYAISDGNGDIVSSKIVYTGLNTKEEKEFEANNPKKIIENNEIITEKVNAKKEALGIMADDKIDGSGLNNSMLEIIQKTRISLGAGNPYDNSYYKGNIVGLTILIDFSDSTATSLGITKKQVEDFSNATSYTGFGNNGSINQYYKDVSGNELNYTNVVASYNTTTYYYRASYPKSYYNDNQPVGTKARDLVNEALTALVTAGFNFSQLTTYVDSTNGNTYFRALNILYAGSRGSNAQWGNGIWPHQGSLGTAGFGVVVNSKTVRFRLYQMTDIDPSKGLQLATFAHENGHMVMRLGRYI